MAVRSIKVDGIIFFRRFHRFRVENLRGHVADAAAGTNCRDDISPKLNSFLKLN
jgi:hypothetical protein